MAGPAKPTFTVARRKNEEPIEPVHHQWALPRKSYWATQKERKWSVGQRGGRWATNRRSKSWMALRAVGGKRFYLNERKRMFVGNGSTVRCHPIIGVGWPTIRRRLIISSHHKSSDKM
eukprot:scaffold4442_cov125-Amphora_coffeaeformis.AAC.24